MKDFIRGMCPPLLWRALARVRRAYTPKPRRMFSGVYTSFTEVADQRPWAQVGYYDTCRAQLRECPAIHPTAQTTHALLAFLINTVPADRVPRILDWGGGTGLRYWSTRPALNRPVAWQVVDDPALAAISGEVMGPSSELSFSAELPAPDSSPVDVLLVYSSLQYVEAQDQLLLAFTRYRPRFIVLPRFMGRDGDGYVTRQLVQGFETPCQVSSIAAITDTLASQRYQPALTIRDGFDLSPMFDDDVPEQLRTGQEWLLVFREAS